jgi:hypothetical protein
MRSKLERIEVSRKHGVRSVNDLLQKRQELVNAERQSLEQSLLLISQQKFMALELRSIFYIEEVRK